MNLVQLFIVKKSLILPAITKSKERLFNLIQTTSRHE